MRNVDGRCAALPGKRAVVAQGWDLSDLSIHLFVSRGIEDGIERIGELSKEPIAT